MYLFLNNCSSADVKSAVKVSPVKSPAKVATVKNTIKGTTVKNGAAPVKSKKIKSTDSFTSDDW